MTLKKIVGACGIVGVFIWGAAGGTSSWISMEREASATPMPEAGSGPLEQWGKPGSPCMNSCTKRGMACLQDCPDQHALDSCTAACLRVANACKSNCP